MSNPVAVHPGAAMVAGDRVCTWDGHAATVVAVLRDGWLILAVDGELNRHEWDPANVEPLLCAACQSAPVAPFDTDDNLERCMPCAVDRRSSVIEQRSAQ